MRLFVALDLPTDVRGRLAQWRDALIAGRADLRPVAEQALHVTLAFLGYRA
jgi:2'-5' RNA ligase